MEGKRAPWCRDRELFLMIKEGDFVIRTADTPWKAEGFLWHPLSFGKVTEFIKCDHKTRPTATDRPAKWMEIVIRPFDNRMAPDGAWLQWVEEECVVIMEEYGSLVLITCRTELPLGISVEWESQCGALCSQLIDQFPFLLLILDENNVLQYLLSWQEHP